MKVEGMEVLEKLAAERAASVYDPKPTPLLSYTLSYWGMSIDVKQTSNMLLFVIDEDGFPRIYQWMDDDVGDYVGEGRESLEEVIRDLDEGLANNADFEIVADWYVGPHHYNFNMAE